MPRSIAVVFLWSVCSTALAAQPDTITPGDSVANAKAILQKYDYEIDASKFGLALAARDRNHALEFCRVDPTTTLVIEYLPSNQEIATLGIVVIPERGPKLDRAQVSINVLAITFDEGGIYTLRLRRATNPPADPK